MPKLVRVSSELSRVPVARRRHAATLLGLLAAFLVAVGVLPWLAATTPGVRAFATITLAVAVLVALIAWGLLHSTTLDARRTAEADLDSTLVDLASEAGAGCDCGHEHDPGELHVTDAGCVPTAPDCPHTCATCTLRS
jgi:hypothetical protein